MGSVEMSGLWWINCRSAFNKVVDRCFGFVGASGFQHRRGLCGSEVKKGEFSYDRLKIEL